MKNPMRVWLVKSDGDYSPSVDKFWVLYEEAADYARRMSKVTGLNYYAAPYELKAVDE